MIGPRAPDLTPKPSDTKPITATSLAKDHGLDEILMKLDDCGGLDALLSCCGLDDLKQSLHSATPVASQLQGKMTRIDLNPYVYLRKPTTPGKQDNKPLLIPDFVDAYSGSTEPEEQEISAGGKAQVIVQAFKQKTPSFETTTLSEWMGASVKIPNSLLLHNNLDRNSIQDYLAYIVKISKLIEEHKWQLVILYDKEYQKLQHPHRFCWGSDFQHLHMGFLKK